MSLSIWGSAICGKYLWDSLSNTLRLTLLPKRTTSADANNLAPGQKAVVSILEVE